MSLTAAELVAQLVPATAHEPIAKAREILSRIADLDGAVDRVKAATVESTKALPVARDRLAAVEIDIDVGQHLEAAGIDPRVDLKALLADRTRLAGEIRALEEKRDRGGRIHDGVGVRRDELINELEAIAREIRAAMAQIKVNVTGYAFQLLTSALKREEEVTFAVAGMMIMMANATLKTPDHVFVDHFRLPDPREPVVDQLFSEMVQLPRAGWLLQVKDGNLIIGGESFSWRDDAILAGAGEELLGIRKVYDAFERALRYTPRHRDRVTAAAEKAARAAEAVSPGTFVPLSGGD